MGELSRYDSEELDDRSNSLSYSYDKVDVNSIGSDEIQRFQDRDRPRKMIEAFEETKHLIDPRYRNCIESIHQSPFLPNSVVTHNENENYRLMFSGVSTCIIYDASSDKMVQVDKAEILLEYRTLEPTLILHIYKLIYKKIDKSLFDLTKFFITFAEVFRLDYEVLYKNIPYSHSDKLREMLKSKTVSTDINDKLSLGF